MIVENKDYDLLWKATEERREMASEEVLRQFIADPNHLMFVEGDNVGLASFEYPGVYNVHWFFKARGREAITLAKRMLNNLFNNYGAKAVRGLVKKDLAAARWATRQAGLRSYGFITYPDGDVNELFCISKQEFQQGNK
jgi:hypothetical protein